MHVPKPDVQNTCAIVVTFNPDAQFPERLAKILDQFGYVILVDNGSSPQSKVMLVESTDVPRLHVQWNAENGGIAAALNQGVALAEHAGFEWAVTFDQDTVIHPNLLQTLQEVAGLHAPRAVLVGANYRDIHRGRNAGRCSTPGEIQMKRTTLITSGTLMPLRFTTSIGGFREEYFIDSVDHEFCLRASANHCDVVMTCAPLMEHRIGMPATGGSFFRHFSSNHPPLRKYFIARNAVATMRTYMLRAPLWSVRQVFRLLAELTSIVLHEEQKRQKATAFARGLWHGLTGRTGPYERG